MELTLSHATGPTEPPLRDITLGQLLAWAAETTPDRVALIAGVPDPAARRQWTYAELHAQALRTAKALRAQFEPGERVAVWAPNLPEWVMLEFGCALAGVVLVTVNPAFRAQELEYVLKQSRSAGIFVVEAFRGNPMHATVQQVAPNCPELRHVIRFDQWEAFLAAGDAPGIALPEVQAYRPGDDPVHLGHHRLSQGRAAAPPRAGEQRRAHRPAHGHPRRRGVDHDDAAVPHRRLRVLRARGGVGARHAGADRGLRARAGAGDVRHLPRQRHGRRADDAGGDDGAPELRRHRPVAGAGHLLGRLHRAGGAGAALRGAAEGALHHRLRPDRMFAGGLDDAARRQRRGQGRHHRHADAACGGEDHRPGQRRHAAGGPGGRVLHARLPRDARLLRERRGHRRGHRRRRLAAHRRPVRDGRARLLHGGRAGSRT